MSESISTCGSAGGVAPGVIFTRSAALNQPLNVIGATKRRRRRTPDDPGAFGEVGTIADRAAFDAVRAAETARSRSSRRRTGWLGDCQPGPHGIHLHAAGSCTPDFKAAPGYINPDGVPHGLRNPEGPDHGDLPNLYATADGSARAEFFTVLVSVAGGEMPALLDEDGSAVIIHEKPDDHLNQPIRRRRWAHSMRRDRGHVTAQPAPALRVWRYTGSEPQSNRKADGLPLGHPDQAVGTAA